MKNRSSSRFGYSLVVFYLGALLVAGGMLSSSVLLVRAAPPRQPPQELDLATVADQINRWHLSAFKGYKFNQWIALGDVISFNQRIADGDLQAYMDPAYLKKLDANAAYVDCEGVGCATYMNDLVLADRPENVPAQTLWHEAMHAIFDAHDSELLVSSDEVYTWYMENVIGQALPWLEGYEKELAKGDKCDPKLLDQKWAGFLTKMQAARETGYGSIENDAQLEQLRQLTGFHVNPEAIRAEYVKAGLDKCPSMTPVTSSALDLIFCIDATGSMEDDIASVKAAATSIVNTIADKNKDYRVALIAYRDWDDSAGYSMFEDFAFSSDQATIISHINSLSVGGGDDTPEAVFEVLMRAIDSGSVGGWRNGVNKQVILMGDAPPHNPSREGLTPQMVAKAAEEADPVVVQAVVVGNSGVYDMDAVAAFRELAELTQGNFFEAADAAQVPEVLQQTIQDINLPKPSGLLSGVWLWVIGGLCLLLFLILLGVILMLVIFGGRRRPRPQPVSPTPYAPYPSAAPPYQPPPYQPGGYPSSPPPAYAPPRAADRPQPATPQPSPQQPPYWQGETVVGMSPVANVAELAIEAGADAGKRFLLKPQTRLGRSPDNDVVLHDSQVSRYHAVITQAGAGYSISDLGSANGVILNGVRIGQTSALNSGDTIVIGGERIKFTKS